MLYIARFLTGLAALAFGVPTCIKAVFLATYGPGPGRNADLVAAGAVLTAVPLVLWALLRRIERRRASQCREP
jgi:hypothetical protein